MPGLALDGGLPHDVGGGVLGDDPDGPLSPLGTTVAVGDAVRASVVPGERPRLGRPAPEEWGGTLPCDGVAVAAATPSAGGAAGQPGEDTVHARWTVTNRTSTVGPRTPRVCSATRLTPAATRSASGGGSTPAGLPTVTVIRDGRRTNRSSG